MLQKNKSKSTSKFKFLIILPLMLAMLTYVSCSSTKSKTGDEATRETPLPPPAPTATIKVQKVEDVKMEDLAIPFAVVENVPIYPGCDGLETNEEQKECMASGINEFVNRNFNTALGKELGITGVNRVYVRFKVSSAGIVTDVESRASHPALEEEAKRVVGSLPNMEPAMHGGEKVAVLYSLPITFMVPEEKTEEEDKN